MDTKRTADTITQLIGTAVAFRKAFRDGDFPDEEIARIGLALCTAVDEWLAYMQELGVAPQVNRWVCEECGAVYLEKPATCPHRQA